MAENSPTFEEWRKLYEAAIRLKEIAPWQWMNETDIFGVQNPETGELGFVSVMGMMGEHYAIAIYLGSHGLYGFWNLQDMSFADSPELLLEIPQLQASFENRNELNNRDIETIKKLGLKFRGHHDWPMFRSYRPGFLPWFLEAKEASIMKYALEQTLDVALRFRENRKLLQIPEDGNYLVRVPLKENGSLNWLDRIMYVEPPQSSAISIPMDFRALEALKKLPPSKFTLEIDFFMANIPINEKGKRPYYPYILLTVDAQGGMILGHDMVQPGPSLVDMRGLIPVHFVHQLVRIAMVPEEIKVRSELLLHLLQPLSEDLDFKLTHSRTLRSLDSAKTSMLQYFDSSVR